MEQYTVTGMSCAACQARVEKAVSKLPGVTACSVSLLTNSMGVEGDVAEEAVIKAVEDAGYGAARKEAAVQRQGLSAKLAAEEEALKDRATPLLKKRLIASLAFLILLMYVSMGHMMWGLPLPAFYDGNPAALGLTELLLAAIVMVINQRFFISGFKAVSYTHLDVYKRQVHKHADLYDAGHAPHRKINLLRGELSLLFHHSAVLHELVVFIQAL